MFHQYVGARAKSTLRIINKGCCEYKSCLGYFTRRDGEIGPALVTTTKESCERAAAEERQLVIDNIEKLSQELPEEMVKEIYSFVTVLKSSLDDNEILLDEINNTKDENSTKFDIAVEEVVNIIISYDMGWSKRGNSRSYDSLNGYGTVIRFLSRKIIDFASRNRKC
ncbi:hypothetical protein PV325_012927 [Microctonus aethiopoides]|nr:hypothetical protein PV325_012927 [Microctonus aethiopoides]